MCSNQKVLFDVDDGEEEEDDGEEDENEDDDEEDGEDVDEEDERKDGCRQVSWHRIEILRNGTMDQTLFHLLPLPLRPFFPLSLPPFLFLLPSLFPHQEYSIHSPHFFLSTSPETSQLRFESRGCMVEVVGGLSGCAKYIL